MLAVLTAGVLAYVWTQPIEQSASAPRPSTASYIFDYTATLPANAVYEHHAIRYGDPVFRTLVDAVTVSAEFELASPGANVVDGDLTARVIVSSTAGWSRVFFESTPEHFTGPTTSVTIPVSFADAWALAYTIEDVTGVAGAITVAVQVGVDANVHTAGDPVDATIRESLTAGQLSFALSEDVARLVDAPEVSSADVGLAGVMPGTAAASTGTGAKAGEAVNGLKPGTQSSTEMVTVRVDTPGLLSLGVTTMTIRFARTAAAVVFAVLLMIPAYNTVILRRARRRGEAAVLSARHGRQLLRLTDLPAGTRERAVQVGSFAALQAAAQRAEADILQLSDLDEDRYFVFDGPTVFSYLAKGAPIGSVTAVPAVS